MEALAHPARRQILLTVYLRGGRTSAGSIAKRFRHAWPTTTRHLKVLEAAGLLTHVKDGRNVLYRVSLARLDVLKEWLSWFEGRGDGKETEKRPMKRADRVP